MPNIYLRMLAEALDPSPPHAWRIDSWSTVDGDPIQPAGTVIVGPADGPDELIPRLESGEGIRFRMRDGDDIEYCRGRLLYADPSDVKEMRAHQAPLLDYGEGGLGCASIEYYEQDADTGRWSWNQYG